MKSATSGIGHFLVQDPVDGGEIVAAAAAQFLLVAFVESLGGQGQFLIAGPFFPGDDAAQAALALRDAPIGAHNL